MGIMESCPEINNRSRNHTSTWIAERCHSRIILLAQSEPGRLVSLGRGSI